MFRKPSEGAIQRFLGSQRSARFSYSAVGATQHVPPDGYHVDHNRIQLGQGRETFRRGVDCLRQWRALRLGWVEIFPFNAPMEADSTVAVVVHHFGFWSLNACRVVYTFDDARRFGFAYGTLPDHAEQGEERFSVEWSPEDDSVWYDILAFSRPHQWQARLVRPLSRMVQEQFIRDSKHAMVQAVHYEL